ncbi:MULTISPECIES: aspartate aminotransferase family protein [Acidiphilium]|jgi:beta-alanine--pyruvate transaminase|uniref:Aminotransferase n=2 Tax=Acidiphilium TaxID=522 RepID=A5FZY3_ACICJ|nr:MULTISPECIES: aspartate aminotransferase family protein [Acidiphilium]MBU6355955.1 aspartate aminotransferase family protein [Rhodospirillales bacterium]ABQ31165.1 aminotransferase [Acidiphilium cryptum JF-5]KDM68110.1 omega-amino acid--pyruvate aminotransferase [Acidiphilium sp. JA12-A1]MDE2328754.1 aspartate aminotransferase family protein [Rhodospirillales bacterium]UNC13551.1 aspartate aminotransferase family protein [Acidiphilium multivorum]
MNQPASRSNEPLIHHWMPFTANKQFHDAPRIIARAEGVHYWNTAGEKLLDSVSGLYTTPAGHGRREIRDAVARQLEELDYAPAFQFGVPGSFRLATELAQMLPAGLNRVFFAGSGSEAVESALKVAIQYHRVRGQGQRQRIIGRARGYHGVNFGGWSVGGMVKNREAFGLGLPGVAHMRHTHIPENRFQMGQGEHGGVDLADDLQRMIDLYGADTIAACIVEPIAGSTGVLVPPKGYLERLREICTKHGILLIFDEVICGFGRTGAPFAADAFGVVPDMLTMAKAITNGNIPMAAVAVREDVQQAILDAAGPEAVEFFHGYTYSAHPVACAAALATLKIFREDDLFARGAALAPKFLERIAALRDVPIVIDTRGFGLLGAVDLAPEGGPGKRGFAVLRRAFEQGLVLRVAGDTVIFAPLFITTDDQLDEMFDKLRKVLATV